MKSSAQCSAVHSDALDLLMSRQSQWPLGCPIPNAEEMHRVFEIAVRAPDHSNLKPWRFIVVQGDALQQLGDVFSGAATKRNALDSGKASRAQAGAAPMLIAIGAHISCVNNVPEIEQMLSVGAAAMNILNALHILGYGAYWASGANAYDQDVRGALGLKGEADRLLGFIYVGTPTKVRAAKERVPSDRFVMQWPSE
jgi:nitroreductase